MNYPGGRGRGFGRHNAFGSMRGPAWGSMPGAYGPSFQSSAMTGNWRGPPPGTYRGGPPFIGARPAWRNKSQMNFGSRYNVESDGRSAASKTPQWKTNSAFSKPEQKETIGKQVGKNVNNTVKTQIANKNTTQENHAAKNTVKTSVNQPDGKKPDTIKDSTLKTPATTTLSKSITQSPAPPITKDQSSAKTGLKNKIAEQLEKINTRYNPPTAADTQIVKSDAYLEHLKKLKAKKTEGGKTPPSKVLDTSQSAVYLEHMKKLQAKAKSPAKPSVSSVPPTSKTGPKVIIRSPKPAALNTPKKIPVKKELITTAATNQKSSASNSANKIPIIKKEPVAKAENQKSPRASKSITTIQPTRTSPRRHQASPQTSYPASANVWGASQTDSTQKPNEHTRRFSEEEFITVDSTYGNGTRTNQSKNAQNSTIQPLRSILKRSHDNSAGNDKNSPQNSNQNKSIPTKIQRRVKPNLSNLEPDSIEVVPSLKYGGQEKIGNMTLDEALAVGLDFVQPVSGYECKLCCTFYHDYPTALHHCTLLTHKMKAMKEQA